MITEEEYLNKLGYILFQTSDLSLQCIEKTFGLSINDVESFDLENNFDQHITIEKRRDTGSFYTPNYIAKYMTSKALFEYFKNNTSLSFDRLASIFYRGKYELNMNEMRLFLELIEDIKIVDLSCGSGVFLINYFKIIKEILLINKVKNYMKYLKKISNNIYAYDINPHAIKSLLLELNIYIRPRNEEEILFIKTFNMDTIMSKAFHNTIPVKGFDIVVGNPPYLGEKGNKEIFNNIKQTKFGKNYYEGKMDLFYYFIYRGINILNSEGVLVYLTTNYFITADGASKLRKFLRENGSFIEIINFNEYKLFDDARGQHNLIFTYTKSSIMNSYIINIEDNKSISDFSDLVELIDETENKYLINKESLFNKRNNIQLYINQNHLSIISKIKSESTHLLKDIFNVNQGLVSGADRVSKYSFNKKLSKDIINLNNINIGDSIYVLDRKKHRKFKNKSYYKSFFKNSDIKKFSTNRTTDKRVLYIDSTVELDQDLEKHLLPFKEILEKRREVKTGSRRWFEIQWPRDKKIFEKEKIVVPQRSSSNVFAYSNNAFYGSADIYYITPKESLFNYPIKVLLALLNSKLFYIYFSNIGKKKGNMLELYATPIKYLMIKKFDNEDRIITICNQLIDEYNECDFQKLNYLIYEAYNISEEEISFIEEFYDKRH